MVVLKAEPAKAIGSLDELMATAQAMERHAAAQYADLAQQLRQRGLTELAGLFARLAEAERGHVESVNRWSQQKIGRLPAAGDIRSLPPDPFDDEAAGELADSRLATPYRILSMAVRNEERAFLTWSYIAAQAEAVEVREAAERMAHEELEHVATLRRARRQAYHAEGRRRVRRPAGSVGERIAQAAGGERRLAEALTAMAAAMAGEPQRDALTLAAEARAMAGELAGMTDSGDVASEPLSDAAAAAERQVEDLLDIADHARDEAVVLSIQVMTRQAIRRLSWLRTASADGRAAAP